MKASFFLVVLVAITMISCTENGNVLKKDAVKTQNGIQRICENTEYDEKVNAIAIAVCSITENSEAMLQLLVAVDKNLGFGMNEEVRLVDILFPEESKIIDIKKDDISILSKLMCDALKVTPKSTIKENLDNEIVRFILENDIKIYFPYSDEWDKKTTPIVVPANTNQRVGDDILAYSLNKGKVEKKILSNISHKNLETTPTFAILPDPTPYSELPEFIEGIYTKNGVSWITRLTKVDIVFGKDTEEPKTHWYDDKGYIYRIFIDNYSFHQLDEGFIWVCPEVRTKVLLANINGKDTTIVSTADNTREFTVKEVKKGYEKGAFIAVQDWRPEFDNSVMTIAVWEEDGGDPIQIPIELSILGKFSIKTAITIHSRDDYQGVIPAFERSVYFQTCRIPFGSNGITSDAFAYYWCGNAKFAIKYQKIKK